MERKVKGCGWVPDLPDGRDLLCAEPPKPLAKLPARVDLDPGCPGCRQRRDVTAGSY